MGPQYYGISDVALAKKFCYCFPCWKVPLLPEDNVRDRVLTTAEFRRLLDAASVHLKPILIVAFYTGMRKSEILKLTWDKVNLRRGYIDLDAASTKTKKARRVYLAEEALAVFQKLSKVRHISGRVFMKWGKPINEIRLMLVSACRKARIQDFTFHDLRHCFATHMRKAGVHYHTIMAMTGHKTMVMFTRYDAIDDEDQQNALMLQKQYLTAQRAGDPRPPRAEAEEA